MPIIPSETLREAGLTGQETAAGIACRLYDAGKLALWPAAKLAGLNRADFEQELINRKIPVHRPSLEDLADDLSTLERLKDRS